MLKIIYKVKKVFSKSKKLNIRDHKTLGFKKMSSILQCSFQKAVAYNSIYNLLFSVRIINMKSSCKCHSNVELMVYELKTFCCTEQQKAAVGLHWSCHAAHSSIRHTRKALRGLKVNCKTWDHCQQNCTWPGLNWILAANCTFSDLQRKLVPPCGWSRQRQLLKWKPSHQTTWELIEFKIGLSYALIFFASECIEEMQVADKQKCITQPRG